MAGKKKKAESVPEKDSAPEVAYEPTPELVAAREKEAELQTAYEALQKWNINRMSGLVETLNRVRKIIMEEERLAK